MHSAPCDLAEVVGAAVDDLQFVAAAKGSYVEFQLIGEPYVILGDDTHLYRMVHNLVDNAIKLAVELVSAGFFAALWLALGASWTFVIVAGGYAFFLLVAITDLKYRLVLNIFMYPTIAALLLLHVLILKQNTLSILLGGGVAFSISYATALLKPGDLGGGDVKLAAVIGLAFGFPQVLWAWAR